MYDIRIKALFPVLTLAFLLLGASQIALARQTPPHTVEFWGGLADWSGEQAEGFERGPATGATFLFHVGIPVEIGLEAAFARMDTDQIVGEVYEFSFAPVIRYRLPFFSRFRPFVGMQAGYTRLSADYEALRFEQNGGLVGGSAGLEIPMGARVMLAGTVGLLYYGYRDTTIFLSGDPVPATGGNAWRYWGRVGLSFRWRH
jgi:hypothetical protein